MTSTLELNSHFLTIKGVDVDTQIFIFSANGNLVQSDFSPNISHTIELNSISAGTYFLLLKQLGNTHSIPFVME